LCRISANTWNLYDNSLLTVYTCDFAYDPYIRTAYYSDHVTNFVRVINTIIFSHQASSFISFTYCNTNNFLEVIHVFVTYNQRRIFTRDIIVFCFVSEIASQLIQQRSIYKNFV